MRELNELHKSFTYGVCAAFDWCPSPGLEHDAKTRKDKQPSKSAIGNLFAGYTHTKGSNRDLDSDDEDTMFWKGGDDSDDGFGGIEDSRKAAETAQKGNRPQNRCAD